MKNLLVICVLMSFAIGLAGCCKNGKSVDCNTKLKDVEGQSGELGTSFSITCPAGCRGGSIWGTDTYTTDSPICLAGIHAGVIAQDKGCDVKVTIVKSLPSYKGSARNGVTTSDWANSWGDTAFQVSK